MTTADFLQLFAQPGTRDKIMAAPSEHLYLLNKKDIIFLSWSVTPERQIISGDGRNRPFPAQHRALAFLIPLGYSI